MSRFLKTFITLSVLLNLLLAGLIIGHVGRYIMETRRHFTLQEIAAELPAEKRQIFKDTLGRAEQETNDLRGQLSAARTKAADLLKAEPFNKANYIAQMQQIQLLHGQIMQHMVDAIAKLAEQSSQEERAILANMLRHSPRSPGDE